MAIEVKTPFVLEQAGGSGPAFLLDSRFCAGNVFFVQSTHANKGDTVGRGRTPNQPFATIDYAVGNCAANQGDVIVVLPSHVETITAAAGLDLDVAGITILGIGTGRSRPKIDFTTATTADLDVDAANIKIENIYFDLTSIDALAAPIDVNAADFVLSNCELETADTGGQCTLAILTDAAADRLTIENCIFHGSTDAGTAAAIRIVGGNAHRIVGNSFQGNYTTTLGAIDNATTPCTNAIINKNRINNRTASSAKAMTFQATSTGQISENHMQILTGTAPIGGADMSWVGANYYAATIAVAGTLI